MLMNCHLHISKNTTQKVTHVYTILLYCTYHVNNLDRAHKSQTA